MQMMKTQKDYEVTVRVRNNWLLRAMRMAGVETTVKLAELSGVSVTTISRLLAFREPYIGKDGEWKGVVDKLAVALRLPPEALVPPQHIEQVMAKNKATMEMDYAEVTALIEGPPADPLQLLENKERSAVISEAMRAVLTAREEAIIRQRFGIDDDEKTLDEIGKALSISKARVRCIEAKALRKLHRFARNPRGGKKALLDFKSQGDPLDDMCSLCMVRFNEHMICREYACPVRDKVRHAYPSWELS